VPIEEEEEEIMWKNMVELARPDENIRSTGCW
jgi:hypothetical protein